MDDVSDLSRRKFMHVGSTALVGFSSSGTVQAQVQGAEPVDQYPFRGVAHLLGNIEDRPEPNSEFFADKILYGYIYETPDGIRYYKRDTDADWSVLQPPQVSASLDLDTEGTVTGSGSSPTVITLPTTLSVPEYFEHHSNGMIEYTGPVPLKSLVIVTATVSGANTTFRMGIVQNGLPAEGRTEVEASTAGSQKPESVTLHGKLELNPGDTLSVMLENAEGTTDLDVNELSLSL